MDLFRIALEITLGITRIIRKIASSNLCWDHRLHMRRGKFFACDPSIVLSVIPMNMSMEQLDLSVVSHIQRHPGPRQGLFLANLPFLAVFRRIKVV